jgi:hypothetical protein
MDYRTTLAAHYDEYTDNLKLFVPDIEEKRNKKNDSNAIFDSRYKKEADGRLKRAYKEFSKVV